MSGRLVPLSVSKILPGVIITFVVSLPYLYVYEVDKLRCFSVELKMKFQIFFAVLMCVLLTACGESNPEAEKAGATAAERWLGIVDSGEYQTSWDQSASMFQSQVTKTEWSKMLTDGRTPLGSLQSRTLAKTSFKKSLPGAPDGEYVISKFDATFEKKAKAVETVTVTKNQDDWKIVGYHIK